jgi:acetolactate synthase I/II/III large subunit
MQNTPIYEALARAFAAEGVDTHFTLMGDGNMHWVAAIQKHPGRFNDLNSRFFAAPLT